MKLYNTMSRRAEEFTPTGDVVKMYVCGPNLYAPCHVGHAMSYIVFDVLRRYLEYCGFEVRHVQNFTDIEDNIINRAQAQGVSIEELSEQHVEQFFRDMAPLNILKAHVYPRATHEIPTIIEMVQRLIENGHAYQANGDVYFRVQTRTGYGKLSARDLDSMLAGARIEPGENKEHPGDFTLWKASKPGEPAWDSPWGKGRPGWHIECSAMSLKYLGHPIDIHGGGQDLIFPHHENEVAQSESYSDDQKPFVRFWVHNGLMRLAESEEKMTRHLGNLVPINEVVQRYGGDGLRMFVLNSHYRSPITFSEESLESAKRGAERLRIAVNTAAGDADPPVDAAPFKQRFLDAMDDDLNTAGALASLFDLAREINRARDEGRSADEAQAAAREMAGVLGLTLVEPQRVDRAGAEPFIELLVELREDLRCAKQYELSDKLRVRLAEIGVILEDGAAGTRWRTRG
ncbi:MAG: cysteine--tRNA ligase [Chloroflexi bacterium RBG_16_64_32]|nr:MAG: cysteine--tRNA ligase [Chloroflexi bacterium RBG_16_64_32]